MQFKALTQGRGSVVVVVVVVVVSLGPNYT
jgi:hypothetical protein